MTDTTNLPEHVKYNRKARAENATKEDLLQAYNEWAPYYEEHLVGLMGYKSHEATAEMIGNFFPEAEQRRKVKILDVAAGTGLVADKLHPMGFANMDALDSSPEMLKIAEGKGLYKQIFCEYFSEKPLDIPENTYDAVLLSGTPCVPTGSLREMIRLTKPGGAVVVVIRIYDYPKFEPLVKELEEEGKWKCVANTILDQYAVHEDESIAEGRQFIYEVC